VHPHEKNVKKRVQENRLGGGKGNRITEKEKKGGIGTKEESRKKENQRELAKRKRRGKVRVGHLQATYEGGRRVVSSLTKQTESDVRPFSLTGPGCRGTNNERPKGNRSISLTHR